MTNDTDRPVIRLKPKANARAIRHGAPWVYDNELVADRRTKKIEAGSIATLEDAGREVIGTVAVTPGSRIFARILDRDPAAQIDAEWFKAKLQMALDHRARLFEAPVLSSDPCRGGRGCPGVIIDRFGDTAVVQPNAAWAETHLDQLTEALVQVTGVTNVLKNASGRSRQLEGLDAENAVLRGAAPDAPVHVPMNGATYLADLTGGQKTGLFYDQRPNHAFAAGLSKGARVLDVFSHVGGFSLAALAGGASSAVAVDGSAAALALAEGGADAMGASDRFATRQGDAFDVLTALNDEGAQFDVVICDPPAFAPSKKALEPGLRAYERVARLAATLVAPGGYLGLCSCSHAATIDKFRNASIRGIGRAGCSSQLIHTGFAGADHPMHPQLAESGYLKALFFRIVP